MAQELRFTDPAFTCEVILSGPAKALYETAQPQCERLKGIRSLGMELIPSDSEDHLGGLMFFVDPKHARHCVFYMCKR